MLHRCAEDDSLLLLSGCRKVPVLTVTGQPFGSSCPSLRTPPNTQPCHYRSELSPGRDAGCRGQDGVFCSTRGSCIQLHTYMGNESRHLSSFYVLTLNV